MDLRWLDDVLILLEERNMTRAAARRHITQPAFSRRIRGFEDWLGAPVLERGANRIDISAALTANEAEIRALTARIRELRGRISNFDPASSIVTIAAQHAAIVSTFPDMALHARRHFPSLGFRLRAGNLPDCVTMFLRGDAGMLLCYEADDSISLPFDNSVDRGIWGNDQLIPVVGGALRHLVSEGGISDNLPGIIYPESSHFGKVLAALEKPYGTRGFTNNPVCETAFSNGIREMVLKGLGVGWLPVSMSHHELESGKLMSLESQFGKAALTISLYADAQNEMAGKLLDIWSADKRR